MLPARIARLRSGRSRAALPGRRGRLGPAGGRPPSARGRRSSARECAAPPRARGADALRAAGIRPARRPAAPARAGAAAGDDGIAELVADRRRGARHLQQRGASFLADIARALGRLPTRSRGGAVGAGGARSGHRRRHRRAAHAAAARERAPPAAPRRPAARAAAAARPAADAGRALVAAAPPAPGRAAPERRGAGARPRGSLLRRYGVVLPRALRARATRCRAGACCCGVLRRLEARGEVRGGRFVAGFVGEQFALPRSGRRAARGAPPRRGRRRSCCVAAADPLNLVGIVMPGAASRRFRRR